MPKLAGRILAIAAMSFGAQSLFVGAAETFFFDDFSSSKQNSSLQGYSSFTVSNGVIRMTRDDAPHYMRTVKADYVEKDFVFEITFTPTSQCQVFIGIGHGDGSGVAYGIPKDSLNFRIYAPDLIDGPVFVQNHPGENGMLIGKLTNFEPVRVRLEKRGISVLFAVDKEFDGQFAPEISKAFPDYKTVAPFLRADDSYLFFGTRQVCPFDDLEVYPPLGAAPFRRGDADGDGHLGIVDPIATLNYLFAEGQLSCLDAADTDDSGTLEITDAVGTLGFLFLGTLAPPPPFVRCAQDPSDDELPCDTFDAGSCP